MGERENQVEPRRTVPAYRFRQRLFHVEQKHEGTVLDAVRSTSALRALRKTTLIPGAKVKVFVPIIVQARRA